MKAVLILALVTLATVWAAPTVEETRFAFNTWVKSQRKGYADVNEFNRRFAAFSENYAFVLKHNQEAAQGLHSYTLGLTKFADLTNAEYRSMLGYRSSNRTTTGSSASRYIPQPVSTLPTDVDWRSKNVVTDVKDQGQCGSCWSFSATGSMEGAHALATGSLVALSEQNLIDCVQNGQYTCDTGGVMQDGFQWVIDNNGIEGESDYPYCTCSGNQCQFDSSLIRAKITGYKNVDQSEAALQSAVATQPGVSIAIDASSQNFQLYSGGVFDYSACSSTQLDHGVLAVGYGTYNGKAYWLVKNSWSASWGMSGYIMMSRNKNNQCGVATDASFATV